MDRPDALSASLLYLSLPRLDLSRMAEVLSHAAGPEARPFHRAESRRGALFTSGEFYLELESRNAPVSPEQMQVALTSGFAATLDEDWSTWVRAHRGSVSLRLGRGRDPETPLEMDGTPEKDVRERMLSLLLAAVTELARTNAPLATYWSQSEQIISPLRFERLTEMIFPLPLFLHPLPTKAGPEEHRTGFRLIGAEDLVGCPVIQEPAPAPLPWLFERSLALVSFARAVGSLPRDGDRFAMAEGESFAVRQANDGTLHLTLLEMGGREVPASDSLDAA